MKNGYELLNKLTDILNSNTSLIESILKDSKENFSANEKNISICLGLVNEIKEILMCLDENFYLLNKDLYELTLPIINYSLFNKYNLVNTYKLYDCLKINLCDLKDCLNKVRSDENV